MNSKNILIAFGVIGIGLLGYKLLLGLILPSALFVSLGYVLKFLLKGSEAEEGQEVSQALTNTSTTTAIENVVEIKPIVEEKTISDMKGVDEEKSFTDETVVEEEKTFNNNK